MRRHKINKIQSNPERSAQTPRCMTGRTASQRWRPMFYMLAAFTLGTVVMSLYLSHHVMTIHRRSVQQNQVWITRLGDYVELSRFASNILVPIRGVFTSHEVNQEQAKMHNAFEQFATYRLELRRDLEVNTDATSAAPLLEDLDMINDSVSKIVEEAEKLYTAFAQRHFDQARRLLTRTNDLHRDIHELLAFLRDDVRAVQQLQYDARLAEIATLQKYEILLAICVVFVVCGIMLQEWQQTKRMQRDSEEKESYHEELREAENRMRTIVDSIADGMITLDIDGRINSWNRAAEHIFGYTGDEIIGHHLCVLLASPDREACAIAFQAGHHSGLTNLFTERQEVLGQRHDGSSFPLDIHLSELKLGQQRHLTGILSDSTERQRVAQLRQDKEAAELANQEKNTFLANMSHELRIPLNEIIGYSKLLQGNTEETSQAQLTPALQRIHAAGKHLQVLFNDILALTKIESGQMDIDLEVVDAEALVHDIIIAATPLATQNGNTLDSHIDSPIGTLYTDASKVRRSLSNLLNNACKFTEAGTITLLVSRDTEDGKDRLTFSVCDTGIGMKSEQMALLFQPFMQAYDASTQQYEGTGLGLVLSRHFCRMLGGDITVDSIFGVGSTFTMRIPAELKPGSASP